MLSKYGIKIKNYKVGSIYEYGLGVRDKYHFSDAMLTNNLFLYFLLDNGLKVINGSTRDLIGVNFDYGSKSYEEMIKITESKIKEKEIKSDVDGINYFKNKLDEIKNNKDKYKKQSIEDLRKLYYTNGIDIEYTTYYKNGNLKKKEIIHYVRLYRSVGKAKKGSCMFINKKLYKKAIDFINMGLKLPKHNYPMVEMAAYSSLVCSTIVDTIKIDPKKILILKDVDSYFERDIISVELDENKHCIAKKINNYKLKNTLFDGQALIDDSIFPKWANGMILLRHHMFKANATHTYIQKFFKDYFKDKYDTAVVTDMWGNEHLAKDIQMITTDNAIKWLKFGVSYEYWCDRVNQNGNTFGIVKDPHESKLGDVQRMSYQMVNSLDLDIMPKVVEKSKEYIELLKKDNHVFLDYLSKNKNFSNDYEVLVKLCEQNWDFTRSEYFRDRKRKIIEGYVNNFKFGKVIQNADNLVIVGSPYAMLLHSVGEDVEKDNTFKVEEGCIQCFTNRFEDDEYLAEFRSPFNSKNNMGYLHNVYSENIKKYFELGNQAIAVNCIHTDFQDRNNGSDADSDSIYTTNQKNIVQCAKQYYKDYSTIVNNIPKEKKVYDYSLENYAIIDTNLASAQDAIGESSNMAQLALTYTYNSNERKYQDYVCILSVIAQISIDSAKRKFDIDLVEEIKRIKNDLNIDKMKYPLFWKHIKDKKSKIGQIKFNSKNINKQLKCPMNYLMEIKFEDSLSTEETLPMSYFFQKFELEENRRKSKKVENLIQKYSLNIYNYYVNETDKEDYFLLKNDFEQLIEDIQKNYISNNYLGLMSWLIDRAFIITNDVIRNGKLKTQINKNKSILLQTLYNVNPKLLLKCLSKNAQK